MSNDQLKAEIEREYSRIGIRPGERVPALRGLSDESELLVFLRQVPDGSGVAGWMTTAAQRAKRA